MNSNIQIIFSCIAGLFLAQQLSSKAQDTSQEKRGFIRLMNAVSVGTGNLDFLVDGSAVNEDGYKLGNVTGGIGLLPGTYRITFKREGTKEGTTNVKVSVDDTTILIPFAEEVPASDDEPAHWAIRILRLKQHETEDDRVASFVSVSRKPEIAISVRQTDLKWHTVTVERLKITRVPIIQNKGYMPVKAGDMDLGSISVAPAGNHVSLLYDDENGNLKSRAFQDYKYLSAD